MHKLKFIDKKLRGFISNELVVNETNNYDELILNAAVEGFEQQDVMSAMQTLMENGLVTPHHGVLPTGREFMVSVSQIEDLRRQGIL